MPYPSHFPHQIFTSPSRNFFPPHHQTTKLLLSPPPPQPAFITLPKRASRSSREGIEKYPKVKMSYQKGEKDFGEAPVRFFPLIARESASLYFRLRRGPSIAPLGSHAFPAPILRMKLLTDPFRANLEVPQDPHHPLLAEGQVAREGLDRAPGARQEQGPPRQGSRPPAHQDPQDHHPQDPQR